MSSWKLTDGLQNLRQQVNERWPDRDHASDGTIGDLAHMSETSGHNPDDTSGSRAAWTGDSDSTPEVRAWDMDVDFREPGMSGQMLIDHMRQLPRLETVIRYMIFNRRMYHSRDDFAPTPYEGPSAHTEHIHFEGAWSQAADENTTFDFRLEEINMPTPAEYAQAVADKLYADLDNSRSGLYAALADRARAGVADFMWGAYHAALNDTSYQKATPATQQAWRNARDILRGVVGAPVDQAAILTAVAAQDGVDVQALADALRPGLAADIIAQLPDTAGLTEADIERALSKLRLTVTS